MSNTRLYTTTDLPIAAYLSIKGLFLIKARKTDKGQFEFILEDPDNIAEELALEFVNSDFCKFDNQIRSIKKLLYVK